MLCSAIQSIDTKNKKGENMTEHEYSADGKVHDNLRLKELQAMSLDRKIMITQARIIEWYNHFNGNVYISFSGGKDSTVLLDIARKIFPDIPAVFSNTGLEYPEVRRFAASFENVDVVYPQMTFFNVVKDYGYPIISKEVSEAIYYARRITNDVNKGGKENLFKRLEILGKRPQGNRKNYWDSVSKQDVITQENCRRKMLMGTMGSSDGKKKSAFNKEKWLPIARDMPFLVSHYCCNVMKKSPLAKYQRQNNRYPYIATMAEESRMRKQAWLRHGCNAFDSKKKSSQPMSFWTEQDVLEYIKRYKLPIASVYGDIVYENEIKQLAFDKLFSDKGKLCTTGCSRTGCVFCAYGVHLEKGETRFQRLAKTHPKQYNFCINGGEWNDNTFYDSKASTEPDEMGWINWNPKKIWTPSKKGLGMGRVFDMLNDVYGHDFIRYK